MPIRILAGSRKGALLTTLPGTRTRPLLGRVRQSLFDILGGYVQAARVLDLFAGSGAVGLEALSRGARWATFVDNHPGAMEIIGKNLAKLRFQERARQVKADLPGAIDSLPLPPDLASYDLVSIMPPYGQGLLPPTLERLSRQRGLVAAGALIVGQFETGEPAPHPLPSPLVTVDERVYGLTHLVFWKWEGP